MKLRFNQILPLFHNRDVFYHHDFNIVLSLVPPSIFSGSLCDFEHIQHCQQHKANRSTIPSSTNENEYKRFKSKWLPNDCGWFPNDFLHYFHRCEQNLNSIPNQRQRGYVGLGGSREQRNYYYTYYSLLVFVSIDQQASASQ